MPLTLDPDMVSRKALAAGFGRENHCVFTVFTVFTGG
jgi:hypothetical protein